MNMNCLKEEIIIINLLLLKVQIKKYSDEYGF